MRAFGAGPELAIAVALWTILVVKVAINKMKNSAKYILKLAAFGTKNVHNRITLVGWNHYKCAKMLEHTYRI